MEGLNRTSVSGGYPTLRDLAEEATEPSPQTAETVPDEERGQIILAKTLRQEKQSAETFPQRDFTHAEFMSDVFALYAAKNPPCMPLRLQKEQKATCIRVGANELFETLSRTYVTEKIDNYYEILHAIYPDEMGNPPEESYALAWGIRVYEKMANNLRDQEDVDYFNAAVGLEYLKGLVQEEVPSDIRQLKPKIRDKWPSTPNQVNWLLREKPLVELFRAIDQTFITHSGAKGICVEFAKEAVCKEWAREYFNEDRNEEGLVYLRQYFFGVEWPVDLSKLEIKDRALLLRKGIENYKRIVDAIEKANCPTVAQDFKCHVGYEALEKELAASREQKDKLS